MAVFEASKVAPKQVGALLDGALGEPLLLS